jgi:hypothetical protein
MNNSVFNLHFMKVSTEIDNNFGYEKIMQLVDNIPLRESDTLLIFKVTGSNFLPHNILVNTLESTSFNEF